MAEKTDAERMARQAREVLEVEARAILARTDEAAAKLPGLARLILGLSGKVILSGVGKSGIIGRKIAATLSSTGTPALFLHPADALMGDVGLVSPGDLLVTLSNSGETTELLRLAQVVRQREIPVVTFTGNEDSSLARLSELTVNTRVEREACPLGLAPTASTTATLALGDALAMILLEARDFRHEDFAAFHPGGSLGRRLEESVENLMRTGEDLPMLPAGSPLGEAVTAMTAKASIGIALLTDDEGKLAGILTDGDLRRILHEGGQAGADLLARPAAEFMTADPKVIEPGIKLSEALQLMEAHAITALAVVNTASKPVGLIHLHDILGRGQIVF